MDGAPAPITLPGLPGRHVVADGRAWVIAGGDFIMIDLVTGRTTLIVTGDKAWDLIVTPAALVWITLCGSIRTQAR